MSFRNIFCQRFQMNRKYYCSFNKKAVQMIFAFPENYFELCNNLYHTHWSCAARLSMRSSQPSCMNECTKWRIYIASSPCPICLQEWCAKNLTLTLQISTKISALKFVNSNNGGKTYSTDN